MISNTVLETPHVVVGAAIATKVVNPVLSLPLAFASHFLLEKVPHWNPHLNTELKTNGKITDKSMKLIIADSTLALFTGSAIAYSALPNYYHAVIILAASFLSVLPDVIEAPYYILKIKSDFIEKRWIPFQKSIQYDTSPLPGLATQFITIVAALYWIFG
jgi:hypothetical protein